MTRRTKPRRSRFDTPARTPRPVAALLAIAALIAAAYAVTIDRRPSASPATGPIILISIDTLRADHLRSYGYGALQTPAIDAIAADGIVFERAYSHAPQTLPSHVSMLSGLLPFQHGVRDNVGFRVRAEERLAPQFLREQGFASGGVASAYVLRRETGIANGFDFYDAQMPPTPAGSGFDEAQRDGAESLAIAERWMASQASPRLFLFLHLYEPHAPYAPPARFARYAPYDGEIAYADEIVGSLIAWLRDRDWYDRSTIFLVSDHGEGLSDHGEQEHGLFLYDEAVHVPLVVKMPYRSGGGRRVKALVQHIDLLPTAIDLAGGSIPTTLPGRSLRPLLEGAGKEWPERGVYSEALLGWYHFGWSPLAALTDSRYRFIRAPRAELYDLQTDPNERRNLASEREQNRTAMQTALDALAGSGEPSKPEAVAPEVLQRLAALGYVGARTTPAAGSAPRGPLADPKDKVSVLVSYRRALGLAASGQAAAAVDVFREIARAEPAMADVWRQLGGLQLRLGRTDEAVASYRQVVRLDPTSASALIQLAVALLRSNRLEAAREHAELAARTAREDEPTDRAAAYEMLAKIALARDDLAGARRYAALAQQADAGFPLPAYVEGRLAYASGHYEAAWAHFSEALAVSGSRTLQVPELHLYAGDTLAHLQRFDEAEREFKQEIQFFATNTWAYISLANLYRTFGRQEEADRVLAAMVQAVPSADARARAARLRSDSRPAPRDRP